MTPAALQNVYGFLHQSSVPAFTHSLIHPSIHHPSIHPFSSWCITQSVLGSGDNNGE